MRIVSFREETDLQAAREVYEPCAIPKPAMDHDQLKFCSMAWSLGVSWRADQKRRQSLRWVLPAA